MKQFNLMWNYCLIALVAIIAMSSLNAVAADEVTINGIDYLLTDEGYAQIVNFDADEISDNLTIPTEVTQDGKSYIVYSMVDKAFRNSEIKTLVVEADCDISEDAFAECTELTSVKINGNTSIIKAGAFRKCAKLEFVGFNDNITEIGINAFAQCTSLKTITLPKNLKKLGGNAFFMCKNLETVNLNQTYKDKIEVAKTEKAKRFFDGTKYLLSQSKPSDEVKKSVGGYNIKWGKSVKY